RTSPDSLTRSSSFTSFAANAGDSNAHARNIADRVFMSPPFGEHFILNQQRGREANADTMPTGRLKFIQTTAGVVREWPIGCSFCNLAVPLASPTVRTVKPATDGDVRPLTCIYMKGKLQVRDLARKTRTGRA